MFNPEQDKMEEECGVFGIYYPGVDVSQLIYFGLFALQHRGQESAGIAVADKTKMRVQKGMGLVAEVFDQAKLDSLKGNIGIGHVRYSTTGSSIIQNAQPLLANYLPGQIALAHNGNLTNANQLRKSLANSGSVFQSTIDTELIVNLIAKYGQNEIEESLMKAMIDLKGSYALVVMNENKLIGVRDPHGNRPLCIGKIGENGYVLASESCALDTINATFIRDVEPGEIVVIDENGINSHKIFQNNKPAVCVFEYIYFARPDSTIDKINVNVARKKMGIELAKEKPLDVDVVIPVPDSGTSAAIGYAETINKPFAVGLLKNRYAGRTFIQPTQTMREIGVKLKLNPIREIIAGKKVALVDDSIVRGTTSRKIVEMVRDAGAKEVHLLVSSPPVNYSCYYGIDTSTRDELIAVNRDNEEIRKHINADSLHYLTKKGMFNALGKKTGFCTACFDGDYPIDISSIEDMQKDSLEK